MIHIVSDTSANLSPQQLAQYNIRLVPIYLYFGNQTFREGIDIQSAEVHQRLSEGQSPTTSEPPSQDFEALYYDILANDPGATIFSIHVSGALSGVVASATQAATKYSEADIHIIDSRSCTIGHAMLLLEAARLADQQATRDEICTRLQHITQSMQAYFALETLGPLANSGRLYRLARMANSLGRAKPLVMIKDGTLEGVDKYNRSEEALPALINLAARAPQGAHFGVTHADREADACVLADHLQSALNPASLLITEISPAFSFYFSRGALGVGWY
jgi:DegV family protein with EDD domain